MPTKLKYLLLAAVPLLLMASGLSLHLFELVDVSPAPRGSGNYVLSVDDQGAPFWESQSTFDGLGNHTATIDLNMAGNEVANAADATSGTGLTTLNQVEVLIEGYIRAGTGSPEGVVAAPVGTLYVDTSGGTGTTLYVKESGTGNTGWVAK